MNNNDAARQRRQAHEDSRAKQVYFDVFKSIQETQDQDRSFDARVIDMTPGILKLERESSVMAAPRFQIEVSKDVTRNIMVTTGANTHWQLKQFLETLPDGPWVLDGRDNDLTIHNRDFNQSPIEVYKYKGPNSEIIGFSASTKHEEAKVDAMSSTSIDDEEKTLENVNLQITGAGDTEGKSLGFLPGFEPYETWRYSRAGSYNQMSIRLPSEAEKDGKPIEVIEARKRETIIGQIKDNFTPTEQELNDYYESLQAKYQDLVAQANEANIEPILSANQLPDFVVKEKAWVEKEVNPASYWESYMVNQGASKENLKNVGTNYYNRWKAGYKYLSTRPNIKIIPPPEGSQYSANSYNGGKIKIAQYEQVEVPIDGARVISRFSSDMARANFKNELNAQLQKEIEADLKVVGNPHLRCGKVVRIENVSSKYSGNWYITKVDHNINSSGYICNLSLIRPSSIVTLSEVSNSVNFKNIYANLANLAVERLELDEKGITQASVVKMAMETVKAELEAQGVNREDIDNSSFTFITDEFPNNIKVVHSAKDTINIGVARDAQDSRKATIQRSININETLE
jgi:hypothetical protein